MNILYEDERVICDESGITIEGFYKPLGDDKKILYSDISRIEIKKISPFAGLSQIWGNANSMLSDKKDSKHSWSAFDLKRIFKSKAIVIDDGTLIQTVITPENVDRVFQILKERTLTLSE